MKIGYVLIVLLAAVAIAATDGVKAEARFPVSFTTTHVPNAENWHFAFPAGEWPTYYSDARLALKIESVHVDGVLLAPRIDEGSSAHISARVYAPTLPASFIYRLMQAQFMFVISRDSAGRSKVGQYEIPMDAKKIEISYRVRYPNGKISRECQVTSLSSYEFLPRE